jgi:iron complex outermembrane receptor protein
MLRLVIPFYSKHNLALFFIFFGLFCAISAQKLTVKGKITDRSNNKALMSATVAAPSLGAGAYSEEDGTYSFEIAPQGADSIELEVKFLGYLPEKTKVAVGGKSEIEQDFILTPEDYQAEAVVITASRGFEQAQSDVPISIEVVKQDFVNRLSTPSINAVIEQIPGVDNLDGQINIRGSSGYAYGVGSRVMVMMDGLPLLSGDAGAAELSLIPVDNIAQIEVIKGASSVLYGSGSVGGVINVITARPDEKPKTSLRFRQAIYDRPANPALDWDGSSSAYQTSMHVFHSRRIGDVDVTLQTDLIKDSGYRLGTDKEELRGLIMTRWHPKKIPGLNLGVNMSTRQDSSGATLYWRSYHPDTTLIFEPGTDEPINRFITGGGLTPTEDGGATRKQITRRYTVDPYIKYLTQSGHLFWYRGRFLSNNNQNNTGQGSQNYIFYNDFMHQKTIGKRLNWTSGVTYTAAQAKADSLYQGTKRGNSLGIYTQVDGKIGDRLNVTVGGRLETVQIDTLARETQPVFRVGANYKIAQGTNVRVNFGQAFRVPSVAERYANTAGGGILVQPNPNLKSEKGFSGEIGFRQGFRTTGTANSFLQGYIDVAGFVTDLNNMVEFGLKEVQFTFDPATGLNQTGVFRTVNVSHARTTGVEFTIGVQGQQGDWFGSLNGGLTLLDPVNLNAVAPENQLDLTTFEDDFEAAQNSGNLLALLEVIGRLNDTTKADNPETLKYRNRTMVRASGSIGFRKFTFTSNFRYRSFMENIDQYLYIVVPDLNDFRRDVNPNGNTVFDFIFAYRPTESSELSLNVSNAFNEEYLVIPGRLAEQRKFTFQYMIRF